MNREWLIRTKNNHILGPVSKDKVKQLISNGSIKGDDEVCSGNGYWIYIKEQELVAKYVFGETKQDFNPVQEVDPVLAIAQPSNEDLAYPGEEPEESELTIDDDSDKDEFGNLMPSNDDLAYPDFSADASGSQTDTTMIDVNLDKLKNLSEDSDMEESDIISRSSEDSVSRKKQPVKKKKADAGERPGPIKRNMDPPQKKPAKVELRQEKESTKKSLISKNVLLVITIVLFLLAAFLLLNHKKFLKTFISYDFDLIPSAQAQELSSKKKSGFHFLK